MKLHTTPPTRGLLAVGCSVLFSIFILLGIWFVEDYRNGEPDTGNVLMRMLYCCINASRDDGNNSALGFAGHLVGLGSGNRNIEVHHVKWLAVWTDNAYLLVHVKAGTFGCNKVIAELGFMNSSADLLQTLSDKLV